MVTKEKAVAAIRAKTYAAERGILLAFISDHANELHQWEVEDDDSDEAIAAFVMRKAAGTAAVLGAGSATTHGVRDESATLFVEALRNAALPSAEEVLSLGGGDVFFPMHKDEGRYQLYVRKCYPDLFKRIHESDVWKHVVSGTPGIGKSLFSYYFMLRLLHSPSPPPYILWEHHTRPGQMWCYTRETREVRRGDRQAFSTELDVKDAWYLADGVPPMLDCAAHKLLVTSPKRGVYKEMEKEAAVMLYMPLWTLDELLDCRSKVYAEVPEEKVHYLFNYFGGVARYGLQHPSVRSKVKESELLKPLKDALHACNIEQVRTAVGAIDMGPQSCHRLLHIVADAEFEKQCIVFATRWTAQEFAKRAFQADKITFTALLRESEGALKGMLYEAMMHAVLAMGGKFTVVPLNSETLERGPEEELDIPACDKVCPLTDDVNVSGMTAAAQNIYLKPVSANFPVIDALKVPEMYLFQMTVSDTERIHTGDLDKVLERLGVQAPGEGGPGPRLYFVVEPGIYHQFRVVAARKKRKPGQDGEAQAAWPPSSKVKHLRSANTRLFILRGTYENLQVST